MTGHTRGKPSVPAPAPQRPAATHASGALEFSYLPYGQHEAVKLLVGRRADARARDNRGKTAFDLAIEGSHRSTAELLRGASGGS